MAADIIRLAEALARRVAPNTGFEGCFTGGRPSQSHHQVDNRPSLFCLLKWARRADE